MIRSALALMMLASLGVADAEGQRRGKRQRPSSRPASTQSTQAASEPTSTTQAAEKEKDRHFAVINGVIHTVTGPVLDGATVLCKNGKILEIGRGVRLPPETEVVDAAGMHVYPGLVAVSGSGIHGSEPPEDTTNVFGISMNIALAGGITTAGVGNTVAKLTFGSIEDMVVRRKVFVRLSYSTRDPTARAKLRNDLDRVRQYLRDLDRHELEKVKDKDAKPPEKEWIKGAYAGYLKLLKRESVAYMTVGNVHQILDACELAETFGFRLVLRGAHEAWLAPGALGRAGVSAIITPRTWIDADPRYSRQTGSSIETARILHDHGVTVAVMPQTAAILTWGVAGRDLTHLNMEAAFAVRGGMSNDDALATITINAARILGIDDRVGSLEVGKDADMVIADGDMLHFMTQVHYTIVNARIVYEKSQDSFFAHIRPDGKPEVADFDDIWPRRLEWPDEGDGEP